MSAIVIIHRVNMNPLRLLLLKTEPSLCHSSGLKKAMFMARECVLYKELMKDLFVYIPSYGKCTILHEGHDQP